MSKVNQPIWSSSQNTSRLTIPAQGIADIRNSLSEILDEFGVDEGAYMKLISCLSGYSDYIQE